MPRRSIRLSQKNSSTPNITVKNRFACLDQSDDKSTESKCRGELKTNDDSKLHDEKEGHESPKPFSVQPPKSKFTSIVNLSSDKLTDAENNVLEKGLNFCIVDEKTNADNLLEDTYRFQRKMKLRTHFDSNKNDHQDSIEDEKDKSDTDNVADVQDERSEMNQLKNPYYNPSSNPPNTLEVYIAAVKNSIKTPWKSSKKVTDNLSEEERLALNALKERGDIVFQQADKGGKTVIMNRDDYIKELETMLQDKEYYKKEDKDKTSEDADDIKMFVENELNDYTSNKEKKFLVEDLDQPRTPVFYGLPKIHKTFTKIPKMRPIVSGFKSCTVKMSEFLDSFLKKQAQKCKSYVKDTNDFLIKLRDLKEVPPNNILVTMDVSSLYTNIDQEEGAEACVEALEKRKYKSIPSLILRKMIMLVLQRNIFRFRNSFYTQTKGTCMGTPMAPNYANLFMDKFETQLLDGFYKKTGKRPMIWWRYIDDIFFIWNDGEESLTEFVNFAQKFSESEKMKSKIKFTVNQSTEEVSFLDVRVTNKNGKISTSVYSKPTDSHLYLSQTSNHPKHVLKNIPKSQFLRLRRICSDSSDFMNQCNKYMDYFTNRGYDKQKLTRTAKEIFQLQRDDILNNPTVKQNKDRVVFTCDWHPSLSQLPGMIKKHHHILEEDRTLKKLFEEPPIVAFRRAKTIRSQIVRSDIEPPQKIEEPTHPCGKCSICKIINTADTLTNTKTGKHLKITAGGNCRTSDIVYAARCKICDLIYVGETGKELRTRFCDHRYDSKSRPDNNEFAEHIHACNHNFETDVEVCILKQGFKSAAERKYWEDKYMCILGTYDHQSPSIPDKTGLNKKVGNYVKSMYKMHQDLT